MRIKVNGEMREFDDVSLFDIVASMDLDPSRVAAELNGEIVPRAAFMDTRPKDGDSLEIVHFVGGG